MNNFKQVVLYPSRGICFFYHILQLGSTSTLASIQQSNADTIQELNQRLIAMKQQYDELDAEKQLLKNELEARPVQIHPDRPEHNIGNQNHP